MIDVFCSLSLIAPFLLSLLCVFQCKGRSFRLSRRTESTMTSSNAKSSEQVITWDGKVESLVTVESHRSGDTDNLIRDEITSLKSADPDRKEPEDKVQSPDNRSCIDDSEVDMHKLTDFDKVPTPKILSQKSGPSPGKLIIARPLDMKRPSYLDARREERKLAKRWDPGGRVKTPPSASLELSGTQLDSSRRSGRWGALLRGRKLRKGGSFISRPRGKSIERSSSPFCIHR